MVPTRPTRIPLSLRHFAAAAFVALAAAVAPGHGRGGRDQRRGRGELHRAAKEIAQAFESKTGHEAILSFGSTGQLYTQITQGAPFEVFLSADQSHPEEARRRGPRGRRTRRSPTRSASSCLFSQEPDLVKGEQTLRDGKFNKIAIANPTTAPYGAAAIEAMKALGVYEQLAPKIVQGNNIAQTFQFVDTGNAELGFVALSQVIDTQGGSRWIVAQNLYTPISQDAVLLKTGAGNEAARAFIDFLQGPEARGRSSRSTATPSSSS